MSERVSFVALTAVRSVTFRATPPNGRESTLHKQRPKASRPAARKPAFRSASFSYSRVLRRRRSTVWRGRCNLFPLWLCPETAYVDIGAKAAVYTSAVLVNQTAEVLYWNWQVRRVLSHLLFSIFRALTHLLIKKMHCKISMSSVPRHGNLQLAMWGD